MADGQTQQQDTPLEQHLRQAGVPSRALSQARAFGLNPARLLALIAKYGPVVFHILEELAAAGAGLPPAPPGPPGTSPCARSADQ